MLGARHPVSSFEFEDEVAESLPFLDAGWMLAFEDELDQALAFGPSPSQQRR